MKGLIFAAFILLITAHTAISGALIEGIAIATDGDTIRIGEKRIRLFGIDAPEKKQTCHAGRAWPCGQAAADELARLIENQVVRCIEHDSDRYGRSVAVCHAAGIELNAHLVRAGLAVATPQYTRRYLGEQAEAEKAKRGIWAGTFQNPADYRRDRR